MKTDERAIRAALDKAADHGWMFETAKHRMDMRSIISAYLAALPAKPEIEGGMRVRVCIGLDEFGNWVACGGKGMPDDMAMSEVMDSVMPAWRPQFQWLEGTLKPYVKPVVPVVEGRVVEG